jgi:hypothetical protein
VMNSMEQSYVSLQWGAPQEGRKKQNQTKGGMSE